MYKDMNNPYGYTDVYYYNEHLTNDMIEKHDGIYCAICGTKTYLSDDGSHRRCPNCDDRPHEVAPNCDDIAPNYTPYTPSRDGAVDLEYPYDKWIVTCSN